MPNPLPIRVLIVDDSMLVRSAFKALFAEEPDAFLVVGEAGDPYEARDKILELSPDVVTLDVEMPRMDGITFLKRIMQHRPTPVVVCSSVTGKGTHAALEALHLGASEVLEKPTSALGRQQFGPTLRGAVRAASQSRPERRAVVAAEPVVSDGRFSASIIAIGSSTGGPAHLLELLPRLPKELPPIVIVQHMPSGFTSAFAARLASTSARDCAEAQDGEVLKPGSVRIAPGGRHLALAGTSQLPRLQVRDGPMINFHRPSVDLFFHSVARVCGPAAVGVILTGMGEDGARGLLAMRQSGARTLGQDEASSIVYGMPKAAWEVGAVRTQYALAQIPYAIVEAAKATGGG